MLQNMRHIQLTVLTLSGNVSLILLRNNKFKKNVIFITGDVHFSEVSKYEEEGSPVIWDLTFSTMSAGPNKKGADWNNSFRVAGKVFTDRNFGLIKVSGPLSARKLEVSCIDKNNKLQYEVVINKE